MKKFLKVFKGGPKQDLAAAASDDSAPATSAPRLNEQLSRKVRNPSLIPGSFFERDRRFKEQNTRGVLILPRTEGLVQFKQGRYAAWMPAIAKLEGSSLNLYPPPPTSSVPQPPPPNPSPPSREQPLKKIQLVGFHLAASKAPDELTISESDNGQGMTIKAGTDSERDEWMVALGTVPGLFRRVEDYFVLGRVWGHGATCEVSECTSRFSGRRLALKRRLHNTRDATTAMHNELRILQHLAKYPHPAIPTLEDFFFDTSGRIELIMQLMEGGELFDWIAAREHLTEEDAKSVFRQIVSGVNHLHSHGIAHRDLKPQNVMYTTAGEGPIGDGTSIKIMDYDLARMNFSPEWQGSTPCGTVHYMAPEVVRREKYSLAIDCWSLGVILYILLSGHFPFEGKNDDKVEAAIEKGQYWMQGQLWDDVSSEAKDLVRSLLKKDPAERLTAAQCLQHPWLLDPLLPLPPDTYSAAAAVASPSHQLPRSRSGSHRGLRTIDNLRNLSTTNLADINTASNGSNDSDRLTNLSSFVQSTSPIKVPPSKLAPSQLSKALDYDLGPLRRQASSLADEHHLSSSSSPPANTGNGFKLSKRDSAGIETLRITLDLVGTEAGIVDSRAAGIVAGGAGSSKWGGVFGPSSPVMTSPLALLAAAETVKSGGGDDDFADLDAAHVEEEDN